MFWILYHDFGLFLPFEVMVNRLQEHSIIKFMHVIQILYHVYVILLHNFRRLERVLSWGMAKRGGKSLKCFLSLQLNLLKVFNKDIAPNEGLEALECQIPGKEFLVKGTAFGG